uniref:Protein F37C4.5 n=1 Tax=Panagrolaimus sp. JU765 TaxID=591449 RepID=A0AC34QL66_9BILA
MAEVIPVVNLNARDIPIKSVTVFTDRAEVIRRFTVKIQPGLNEVILENVAGSVEQNSIRVDGIGAATIHEVKFESKPSRFEDVDTPKVRELTAQLKKVEAEFNKENDVLAVYKSRLDALDTTIKTIGRSTHGDNSKVFDFTQDAEASLDRLFDYHEKKSMDLKSRIRIINEKVQDLQKEIDRINQEIHQIRYSDHIKNFITIQVENHDQANSKEIEMEISYQVYGARWTPSYDIRVKTLTDQNELKLVYFGNIQQQTGEDWNDIELSLSTATPGMGGDLPKLGTTIVEFYRPPPPAPAPMYQRALFGARGGAPMMKCARNEMMAMDAEVAPCLSVATAIADENVLSTTFTIPVRKNIPSDTSEHKVTITVEDLKALLHYQCVPKKTTNVYLTALVINNSDYPLLAGQASVYLNNSLSANVRIRPTSCGEKFECPLGVDKTVKVIYKPTHKFQAQIGTFSKTSTNVTEQRIIVKNTKRGEAILITLHESVPKSSDEKIKVKLGSPDLKNNNVEEENKNLLKLPEIGAKLNDLHNLQWTASLNANEEREFLVKWMVEYPPNESLVYVEKNEYE